MECKKCGYFKTDKVHRPAIECAPVYYDNSEWEDLIGITGFCEKFEDHHDFVPYRKKGRGGTDPSS